MSRQWVQSPKWVHGVWKKVETGGGEVGGPKGWPLLVSVCWSHHRAADAGLRLITFIGITHFLPLGSCWLTRCAALISCIVSPGDQIYFAAIGCSLSLAYMPMS